LLLKYYFKYLYFKYCTRLAVA